MILYVDTSALVKLYVEEPGSTALAAAVEESTNLEIDRRCGSCDVAVGRSRWGATGEVSGG